MLVYSQAKLLVWLSAAVVTSAWRLRAELEPPSVHFIFPEGRGTSISGTLDIGPCQGQSLGARTRYPLSGGMVSLNETSDATDIRVLFSTSASPTEQNEFIPLTANHTESSPTGGQSCFAISNLSAIGLNPGQNITFQLNYQRNSREYYECADVTLITAGEYAVTGTTVFCGNTNTNSSPEYQASVSARATSTAAPTSCPTAAAGIAPTNLNAVQGGIIGAMAAVIAVAIAHFIAYIAGVIIYGRKAREISERIIADDMTERSLRS